MSTAISRQTSTVSLVSQSSTHLEAVVLVQCLNKYMDVLQSGCERVLKSKYEDLLRKGHSGTYNSDNISTLFGSRSPSGTTTNSVDGHLSFTFRRLDTEAREALAQHLIELLATIILPDPPQSTNEVDNKLAGGLPSIPEKMMPTEADAEKYRELALKKRKSALHLPVKEIYAALKEFNGRFSFIVCLYIVAIAEHIIGQFLQAAICYEEKALTADVIRASTVEALFRTYRDHLRNRRKLFETRLANMFPQDYDKCVDELYTFLHTSLDQLNLLLRVFREPVLLHSVDNQSEEDHAHVIFGSLLDLYNNLRIFMESLDSEEEDLVGTVLKGSGLQCTPRSQPVKPSMATGLGTLSSERFSFPDLLSSGTSNTAGTASAIQEAASDAIQPKTRRLVGIALIELAEDDSLHMFSQYATTLLNFFSRDRIWALVDNGTLVPILCRLSRTILHTISRYKSSTGSVMSDLRSPDPHSFTCNRCCSWDSVPSPRRRSTSSSALLSPSVAFPTGTSTKHNPDTVEKLVRSPVRQHRASQSSVGLEDSTTSANCNYLTNAFKYLLPRLLLLPIFQFLYLHELIKTLHHLSSDEGDRARLNEVLSMLTKTRSSLERDLSKHPWICLQLTRLISTGHLGGQFRSLYMELLAGTNTPPSPNNRNIPSSPTAPTNSNGHSPPCVTGTQGSTVFRFPATGFVDSAPLQHCAKAEEIERLLGGREKLLSSHSGRNIMGDFVLEGRIHLATETKRFSVEHIAYLFTGILFICKWQERRSALNPAASQVQVLRVKHRIPLEAIHVNDLPPLVQPNLPAHIGNSGTITSSAVGAAVLAAASAGHGAVQHMASGLVHPEFPNSCISNLIVSGMHGSITSQTSLATIGGYGLASYPYMFELEYVDSPQSGTVQSNVGTNLLDNHPCCQHHPRHTSPLKSSNISNVEDTDGPRMVASAATGLTTNGTVNCSCFPPGSQVHHITLAFRTPEEKADWMASLLSIQWHRPLLRYIRTLPKLEIPLRLPSSNVYRFAQPDTPEVIVFDTPSAHNTGENACDFPDSLDSSEEGLEDDDEVSSEPEDFGDHATTPVSLASSPGPTNSQSSQRCNVEENTRSSTLTAISTASGNHDVPPHTSRGADAGCPQTLISSAGMHPQLRLATLEKLIERLTYPTYFDTRLVNTFLLAYRRVTTPETFLDMLIERFRIPDPEFLPEEFEFDESKGQLESPAQHMLKRFRSGYKKRVQTRVLLVLSRWVRNPRYFQHDFLPNPELRRRLSEFLATIQVRHLNASVRRIQQHLQAHTSECTSDIAPDTALPYFTLESCTGTNIRRAGSLSTPVRSTVESCFMEATGLDITTIHPYRLAEQVTLYEWELYRAVQFWEVEGRDRVGNATPNLDRSKSFSNRFRNWLVYAILAEPHIEDRCVAIKRVIDLMLIMEKMNNLQGSQEAKSALISAAVFRLRKSFQAIRRYKHYREVVDRLRRENTSGSKPRHKSPFQPLSSGTISNQGNVLGLNTTIVHDRSNSSATSSQLIQTGVLGLPFATRSSKAHERRIKVLEKQHASGTAYLPCVPFIAAGVMTRLIHLDLRHPDTITTESGTVLINCWKHRQLADVVERYLAFQRIPYLFDVKPGLRKLLEQLDPLDLAGVSSESEFEARMYELSMAYEPRESDSFSEAPSPVSTTERRMSKEAIEASNTLSSLSLKERMSLHSMFSFEAAIHSTSTHGRTSSKVHLKQRSKIGLSQHSTYSTDSFERSSPSELHSIQYVQHKYRPSLNSEALGSTSSTQSLSASGGVHQHSMSDSLITSASKRLPPNVTSPSQHQQTLSAVYVPTHHPLGLSPPTTPLCAASHSSSGSAHPHSNLPPPLPPRKSQQANVIARTVHSPSPLVTTTTTTTISAPATPHAKAGSNSPTPGTMQSDQASRPPPLPPRISGLNRTSLVQPDKSGPTSSSPVPHSDGAFIFNLEALVHRRYLQASIPPPLPPRRTVFSSVRPRSNERPAIAPT